MQISSTSSFAKCPSSSSGSSTYQQSWPYLILKKQEQEKESGIKIRNGRNASGTDLPISVLHEAFGAFGQKSFTDKEIQCGTEFLHTLCSSMQHYYDNEADRASMVRDLFTSFLKLPIIPSEVADHLTTDGSAAMVVDDGDGETKRKQVTYVVFEVKKEEGSTGYDPFMQAFAYSYVSFSKACLRRRSVPCFLIIISGPNLAISGSINADTFVLYQQLTPNFSLVLVEGLDFPSDLLFSLLALKKAVNDVTQIKLHKETSDFPFFSTFMKDSKPHHIKYTGKIKGLVFKADLKAADSTAEVIVKFSYRYGYPQHQLSAQKGYSPNIIHYFDKQPPWHIVMEYWNLKEQLFNPNSTQLQQVQDFLTTFKENRYVHGDLRSVNVWVNGGNDAIAILDFDWAGEEGSVRYPFSLNTELQWPDGASPGALITHQHDEYWINQLKQPA